MGCVQTTYYGIVHVLKGFWAEDGNESFTSLVMPWCQTKNTLYCQQREVGATYSICSYSRWKECVSLFLSVDCIDSWDVMALGSREFDSLLAFLMSRHSSCCNGIPIVDGLQTTLCVASIRLSWQAIWYFLAELLLSLHREFMNCGFYILMFCQLWQDTNKGQYIFLFNWESLFISYYEDNWENCVFWHF